MTYKTFKRSVWTLSLCCVSFLLPVAAQAQRLKMTMDDPSFKPFPIAMPDVNDTTGGAGKLAANELTKTLRSDLSLSPAFLLLDAKSYLTNDKDTWLQPRFPDWLNIGASGLVRGGVTNKEVTFKYFDVVQQRETLTKTYKLTADNTRAVAHAFADELTKFLTGQVGGFSSQIAFTLRDKKSTDIYSVDFDGASPRKLTKNGAINLLPSWDRTGPTLFYTSYQNQNPDLFMMDTLTGVSKSLSAQRGLNTGAAVSPDGKHIALTLSKDGNSEIYVMNRDGSGLKRLTENWWIDTSPTWNPDGTKIAYVSSRTGAPHIYVMNADGSNQTRLTHQGNYNQTPEWSPRGNEIAFTARDERFRFDIFSINVDTKEVKRLTQDQGNNEEPSYSPDGRMVVFTSNRTGDRKLFIMTADGQHQRQIYFGTGDCETPAWSGRFDLP